jgi:DNA-binding NtrC family response regulator
MKMPGLSGLELLNEVKARSRDTVFILMTAYGTVENAVAAMKAGAYDYLSKPLDMHRLRALVLKALEFQALVAENNELRLRLRKRSEPNPLVGTSEAISAVARLIDEVARERDRKRIGGPIHPPQEREARPSLRPG